MGQERIDKALDRLRTLLSECDDVDDVERIAEENTIGATIDGDQFFITVMEE